MNKPNPQMQEILDVFAEFKAPPLESLSPGNARNLPTLTDAVMGVVGKHITKRAMPFPEPVGSIAHKVIPTKNGELLARIYYPNKSAEKNPTEKLPVALYFHGGGWVIANLDTYDGSCRALCNESKYILVSIAYRQAPEFPFPAAVDDAFEAYQWLTLNAGTIGGDSHRIAVVGESAGGNLAAVVALKAKATGTRDPIHQVLVYPVTDFTFQGASHREYADAKPLNQGMMEWFKKHYLQNESDVMNPDASPLFAKTFSGLPAATIITAEIDPLCSDGEIYADKLKMAGVKVVQQRFDGVTHEFFGAKALLRESKEAIELAAKSLIEAAQIGKDTSTAETIGLSIGDLGGLSENYERFASSAKF